MWGNSSLNILECGGQEHESCSQVIVENCEDLGNALEGK